jgi:hypothetical protein
MPNENPPRLTAHLGKFILLSTVVTVAILAIGGFTGFFRTEFKAKPYEEAIMLVLGWSCYGPVFGIALCLIVGAIKKLLWKIGKT